MKFLAFLNAYKLEAQLIRIHNSLHSSRPYWRMLENPKTWGSREIFLHGNYFKTYSTVKSREWLWKGILWFLGFFFIWSTFPSISWNVIRRKKERKKEILTFQNNKEIHNGCAKMQKYIVAGSIKEFLIIC